MGCGSSSQDTFGGTGIDQPKPVSTSSKITNAKSTSSGQYEQIDRHAKTAPKELRNSVSDLAAYMLRCTKDHKLLVRGIFVWISENIMYDIDGFSGKRAMGDMDSQSVMKNGYAVCEGYANVMKDLCEATGVAVKKLSGYSKGVGYDPATPFSTSRRTDHAWNAVQLDGKWYLLDSTWGTGHVNGNEYEKSFEEFYFLTKPEEFINDHFPYMDGDMEESMKWQLLKNHVSLSDFSKGVLCKPHAFTLGIVPKSHNEGHIVMSDEAEIELKSKGKETLSFSARLMHNEGRILREQSNATFATFKNGIYSIFVHPKVRGKYTLDIFAKKASDESSSRLSQVISYSIQCNEVKDGEFEYPLKFGSKLADQCSIIKPKNGRLRANSEVYFEITAPHLEGMSVNQTILEKKGSTFQGNIKTGDKGYAYTVSSAVKQGLQTSFEGLFQYHTV